MNFVDAVRLACQSALRADDCRVDHAEWQLLYRRKESVGEFCQLARELGFDARDDGDGVIAVYESVGFGE